MSFLLGKSDASRLPLLTPAPPGPQIVEADRGGAGGEGVVWGASCFTAWRIATRNSTRPPHWGNKRVGVRLSNRTNYLI